MLDIKRPDVEVSSTKGTKKDTIMIRDQKH